MTTTTLKRRLKNAWHNRCLHPVAGICWLFGFKEAGDRIHGEEKPRWWIIAFTEDGPRPLSRADLPTRPADARPDGGDPFTPWEQTEPHLHTDDHGRMVGAHVWAYNLEDAYRRALALVAGNCVPLEVA